MNAMLTIQVRVAARQAQKELQATAGSVGAVNAAAAGAGAGGMRLFNRSLQDNFRVLSKWGKNLQWAGRQLSLNFTLPIAAAGFFATKWALDNERAMTQVRKVYDDAGMTTSEFEAEISALGRSFEMLSSRFGENQSEVLEVAAAWAQTGSAGVGLAKNVRNTLEAAILGDFELMEATQALIATMAAYGLSSEEMTTKLALLNAVENNTAVRMRDLIDVIQRAGGAARAAGVEVEELAAMAAQLVPAGGGASQAGNALRTMISRLMSPTRATTKALQGMGIETESLAWTSLNFTERLERMSRGWEKLTSSEQAHIASVIASRWQVNRFNLLMRGFGDTQSYYRKAAKLANDETDAMVAYQRELSAVLESNPKRMEIMGNVIKNSMAAAMVQLLPAIIGIVQGIASLAQWFANLDPSVQKVILSALLFMAVTGPIIQYLGALTLLIGEVGTALMWLGKGFGFLANVIGGAVVRLARLMVASFAVVGRSFLRLAVMPMLAGIKALLAAIGTAVATVAAAVGLPVWALVAIVAAVIAAIIILFNKDLRDGVLGAIQDIMNGLGGLPSAVASVFHAVVRVVASAMRAVIEWLSYLNPFARHSPSLVDNVRAGVATILNEYNRLRGIPSIIRSAAAAHKAFLAATSGASAGFRGAEMQEQRTQIVTAVPSAGPAVDGLISGILALESTLPKIAREIENQVRIVANWEAKLKPLSNALRAQELALRDLEYQFGVLDAAMQDARDTMNELVRTPISGMKAFEDAIFDNEMAQKALRLEILRLEEAGQSVDDLRRKYADLNGMIELLRGERESLRMAGAGSDILSVYDKEISALQAQRDALEGQGSEVEQLTDQLEELQRQAEILELEKAINFDPQLRQIDEMVNGLNEMPFDEIVASIKEQQATIDRLQPSYDLVNTKLIKQRSLVEATRHQHDRISDALDVEKNKLSELNQAYSDIESQIREMESAMSGFAQQAERAAAAAGGAGGGGGGGGTEFGDFDVPGGEAVLGREGDLFDIEQFNKELEKELEGVLGDMDIFAPMKEMWSNVWEWLQNAWSGAGKWIKKNPLFTFEILVFPAMALFRLLRGAIEDAMYAIGRAVKGVWDDHIWPVFEAIWDFVEPVLVPIINLLASVAKTQFQIIAKVVSWAWNAVVKPVFDHIWGFIDGFLIPIFTLFRTIVDIVWTVVGGVIRRQWNSVILPVFNAIWNFVKNDLGPAFTWFKNNIITPVWNGIKSVISTVWDTGIKPVFDTIDSVIRTKVGPAFTWLRDNVISPVFNTIASIVSTAWGAVSRILQNGVNFFITIFNGLARAVNAVASAVGSSSRVQYMGYVSFTSASGGSTAGSVTTKTSGGATEFAQGGVMTPWGAAAMAEVGSGFITNNVRAIVGEGSHHPEYVIPTDPRYRKQAMALFSALGGALIGEAPAYGEGGILDFGKKLLTSPADAIGFVTGLGNDAVNLYRQVSSIIDATREGFKNLGVPILKDIGSWMVSQAWEWIKDAIGNIGKSIVDIGRSIGGEALDAANNAVGWLTPDLAAGGQIPQYPIDMATGGIIRRRAGGTLLRVGEGRHDEKVQVLPVNRNDDSGGNTYNFYGDLEFPNITSGDDAEEFVSNLEKLAG